MVGVHLPKSAPARLVVEFVAAVVLPLVAEPVLALVLVLELLVELELAAVLVLAVDAVELLAELAALELDASLFPLASTVVKLEKPCWLITCATERPFA